MGNLVGRKNVYTCESCGKQVVTVDLDDGVTPYLIGCVFGCHAPMRSSFYRVDQALIATHEWYKPGEKELAGMTPEMRDHVERGGLDLRPIPGINGGDGER